MPSGRLIQAGCTAVTLAMLLGCKETTESTSPDEAAEVLIHPGVGVGALKFGMNVDQMREILGEPDSTQSGRAYEYLSKGMAVVTASGDVGVIVLMFGDSGLPDSRLIIACKYRTAKGIGMGSTWAEIVEAYGEPSSQRTLGGVEELTYPALNAKFSLRSSKVVHMQFRMPR